MERNASILMADLTGYTAMTDAHGGASAAKVVRRYMELVNHALQGSAKVVQRIGDQVVIVSDHPDDVVITAQQLNLLTQDEHHFLSIHAGIHCGSIFFEDDSLFGSTINIASRIMNLAGRGQVLCSAAVVDLLDKARERQFMPLGKYKLKNVPSEIELFELVSVTGKNKTLNIDPVCHMLVDQDRSQHSFRYQETLVHFCSEHCLTLFRNSPGTYLPQQEE